MVIASESALSSFSSSIQSNGRERQRESMGWHRLLIIGRIFAKNVVDFIVSNNLDGVDFDWEYPGVSSIFGKPVYSSPPK